jgi:hypothetical protein
MVSVALIKTASAVLAAGWLRPRVNARLDRRQVEFDEEDR